MNENGDNELPDLPWRGGCQCGQVRYTLQRPPLMFYACHCTECQKQSASAFGLSVMVRKRDVDIEGETAQWSRPTETGNVLHCRFCPECGSRMFHDWPQPDAEAADVAMNLKGGTLDDALRDLVPAAHIWIRSKQAGTVIPDGVPVFEQEPGSRVDLIAAFARTHKISAV